MGHFLYTLIFYPPIHYAPYLGIPYSNGIMMVLTSYQQKTLENLILVPKNIIVMERSWIKHDFY